MKPTQFEFKNIYKKINLIPNRLKRVELKLDLLFKCSGSSKY